MKMIRSWFNYEENEIEYIPPQVIRFLNRIKNIDNLQVYNDSQNIHNHSIQESVNNSINNIMQQKFIINDDNIMNEILNDNIFYLKFKFNYLVFKLLKRDLTEIQNISN